MVTKRYFYFGILSLLLYSCGKAERNVENIKKISTNMTVAQVEQIMGKPDSVLLWPIERGVFRYMYEAPLGASDNIYVMFSRTDSIVVSKNDGM